MIRGPSESKSTSQQSTHSNHRRSHSKQRSITRTSMKRGRSVCQSLVLKTGSLQPKPTKVGHVPCVFLGWCSSGQCCGAGAPWALLMPHCPESSRADLTSSSACGSAAEGPPVLVGRTLVKLWACTGIWGGLPVLTAQRGHHIDRLAQHLLTVMGVGTAPGSFHERL